LLDIYIAQATRVLQTVALILVLWSNFKPNEFEHNKTATTKKLRCNDRRGNTADRDPIICENHQKLPDNLMSTSPR